MERLIENRYMNKESIEYILYFTSILDSIKNIRFNIIFIDNGITDNITKKSIINLLSNRVISIYTIMIDINKCSYLTYQEFIEYIDQIKMEIYLDYMDDNF